MNGFFGNLFDFNHNGKIDTVERAAEFVFLDKLLTDVNAADSDDEDGEAFDDDSDECDTDCDDGDEFDE